MVKQNHILVGLSVEQLYQLYLRGEDSGNESSNDVGFAKKSFGKVIRDCEDLTQLESLRETYASCRKNRVRRSASFNQFWDTWQYERALKRLRPEDVESNEHKQQSSFPNSMNF